MRWIIAVLMLFCAMPVSLSAAETPDVLAGPWMTLLPDGGVRLSLTLSAVPSPDWLKGLIITEKNDVDVPLITDSWQVEALRDAVLPRWIISHTIDAALLTELSEPRLFVHGIHARESVSLLLPRRPWSGDPVRIMVAPGRRYPTSIDIAELAERLGGAVQAVILLGSDNHHAIGTGGWESRVPLIHVAADDARGGEGSHVVWRSGLSWGDLGLPIIMRPDDAAMAIARDLNPFQVVLQGQATWRIGLSDAGEDEGNRILFSACRRHRVPLVLAAGSGAGFLSDPLALRTDNTLDAMPGGSRYAVLGNGDDPPAAVTDLVARIVHGGLAVGLALVDGRMQVAFHPLDHARAADAWTLHYNPWPEAVPTIRTDDRDMLRHGLQRWIERGLRAQQRGRLMIWRSLDGHAQWQEEGRSARAFAAAARTIEGLTGIERERMINGPWPWPDGRHDVMPEQHGYPWPMLGLERGCGWGIGDVRALLARVSASDGGEEAMDLLAWLPRSALTDVMRGAAAVRDHIDLAAGSPALMARFAAVSPLVAAEAIAGLDAVDPGLVREVVLRALVADDEQVLRPVADLIIRSQDNDLIRVIERRAAHGRDIHLLRILMWRLQAQAAGDVPLEQDPLLQHRVISTVFGSPYLSPTPLRRIALKLEEQVHPLAAESLRRFLERHGRQRP